MMLAPMVSFIVNYLLLGLARFERCLLVATKGLGPDHSGHSHPIVALIPDPSD
jgi:hypothetical protein